jgi:asparagine synthase (glutamine-hydrolysing)
MVFYELTPGYEAASRGLHGAFTPRFAQSGFNDSILHVADVPEPWGDIDVAVTRLICETYLVENGLAQVDRLGMASSVEVRQPLVDYRLVETVIGLRKHRTDASLPPKQWFRDAVQGLLPDFVLERPKRGFTPPWRQWARATAKHYDAQLANGYLVSNEVLEPDFARRLARRLHVPPWGRPSSLAESALALELWCRSMAQASQHNVPDADCLSKIERRRERVPRPLQTAARKGASSNWVMDDAVDNA